MALDVSEFEDAERSNGSGCWWVTRTFTPEQRETLEYVMFRRVPRFTAAAISRVLTDKWKIEVGEQAVRRHRNGGCHCKKAQ